MSGAEDIDSKPRLKVISKKSESVVMATDDNVAVKRPRHRRNIRLLGLVALVGAGLLIWQGFLYWTVGRYLITTDDAAVGTTITQLAPKIAAYVIDVPVVANQQVKTGDVLVRLDSGDLSLALEQAEAKLATQRAMMSRIRIAAEEANAAMAQAQAAIQAADVELVRVQAAFDRATQLNNREFASRSTYDNALADRDRAKAQGASARAQMAGAQAFGRRLTAEGEEAERVADELTLQIQKARRDLSFTVIKSPIDGVVSARNVQVGDYMTVGKRILSLVPLDDVYVDANFKETQLAKFSIGDPVIIKIDAFPDVELRGRVMSLAAGTGSTFSLLPPDNATGNFTKIVQRVPVRIALEQRPGLVLRPGMSAFVSVDTRKSIRP